MTPSIAQDLNKAYALHLVKLKHQIYKTECILFKFLKHRFYFAKNPTGKAAAAATG